MSRDRRMPDIGLFFVGAVPNDNVFLVAIRVAPVRVKSGDEVAADILTANKERRADYSTPFPDSALRSQRRGARSGRLVSTFA